VYVDREEEMIGLRGRVDVARTLRASLIERGRTFSRFADLEYDSPANRLLKATLHRCAVDHAVPPMLKRDVTSLLRTMDVAGVCDVRPTRAAFRQIQIHRGNRRYRFLLHVAELLMEGRFPDGVGAEGPFTAVMRDEIRMAKLFERFLLNFYRSEQATFRASAEVVAWQVEPADELSAGLLPIMKTDIVLRSSSRTIVADAKFYRQTLQSRFGKETVRSEHLYQLFSYLVNLEERESCIVEGMLIYPTVQRDLTLRYQIAGRPVAVVTVDLTAAWPIIRARLLDLLHIVAPGLPDATDSDLRQRSRASA
jgi:5-methylcytosine-specific restriction enzyme subunit McrC